MDNYPLDAHPPLLAVDAHGYVWRVYENENGELWSMAPANADNSPIPHPVTYYVPKVVFAKEDGDDT